MKKPPISLTEALGIGGREHVALVGGGGKTTLMLALAEELREKGGHVVTTTTTKVWHEQALQAPRVILAEAEPSWAEKLKDALAGGGHVFLGNRVLESEKVEGIDPSLADRLFQQEGVDYVLVEADGSANRPVKAPASHEPVIPETATEVVAFLGLEAIGRKLGPDIAFRPERVTDITGLRSGQEFTVSALSKLFLHPLGLFKGSPGSARRVVFLNKLDLLSDERKALMLADLILADRMPRVERVVIGSLKKGEYVLKGE